MAENYAKIVSCVASDCGAEIPEGFFFFPQSSGGYGGAGAAAAASLGVLCCGEDCVSVCAATPRA